MSLKRVLFALISLMVASNFIWLWHTAIKQTPAERYNLVSPRIFATSDRDYLLNFAPLREALKMYFSKINVKYSFYFEYLPTGVSIQIGEGTELVSASLLKVPLVMDFYKAVENGDVSMDKEVTIAQKDIDRLYGSLWEKGPGAKITLRDAVRYTLVDSDNTAANLIRNEVVTTIAPKKGSFNELDIPTDKDGGANSVISAKAYSSILKCLYLSCFVEPSDSQEILKLMSSSKDQRIRAGVPSDIIVANKIGTFSTKVQSDCGIVYAPNRPYLICMMIALPEETADPHIHTVSNLVYSYVSDRSR